jgi:hypothetical protein
VVSVQLGGAHARFVPSRTRCAGAFASARSAVEMLKHGRLQIGSRTIGLVTVSQSIHDSQRLVDDALCELADLPPNLSLKHSST